MDNQRLNADLQAKESNLPMILGVVGLFHVFAVIISALRAYTRFFIKKTYKREDYVIAVSTVCAFACFVDLIQQGQHGLGMHYASIPVSDEIVRGRLDFILTLMMNIGVCLLKISIALSLLSLIDGASIWTARILWALIVFIGAYTCLAIVTNVWYCSPVSGAWDPTTETRCFPISLLLGFALSNSSFSIFSDVALAILPISIIWKLQMPLRTRLYVIGILSLGYFAVAMCAVKVYFQFNYASDTDPTFFYSIQFFYLLELNIGITASCLPYLKPLLSRTLGLSTQKRHTALQDGDRPTISGGEFSRSRHGYVIHNIEMWEDDFELRQITGCQHTTFIEGGHAAGVETKTVTGETGDMFVDMNNNSQSKGIKVTMVTEVTSGV